MARPSRSERPGSPRARLFVALDVPGNARRALAAWSDAALAGRDDLRRVGEESLHVTLAFLGWRPEKEVERIAQTLEAALERVRVARLRPGTLVALPPRHPRLLALELKDEGGRAMAVQAAAGAALAGAGFYRPEARPWWPHVTIARVGRGRRADPLEAPAPQITGFDAADVTLYRSTLRPQGALYEPLARLHLRT